MWTGKNVFYQLLGGGGISPGKTSHRERDFLQRHAKSLLSLTMLLVPLVIGWHSLILQNIVAVIIKMHYDIYLMAGKDQTDHLQ